MPKIEKARQNPGSLFFRDEVPDPINKVEEDTP